MCTFTCHNTTYINESFKQTNDNARRSSGRPKGVVGLGKKTSTRNVIQRNVFPKNVVDGEWHV